MSAVTLNAGAGGAIMRVDTATSSEQVQVVKLAYGDTGTFNYASTALPLPVIISSAQSTINVLTSGPLSVLTSGPLQVLTSGALLLSSAGITQVIPVTSSGVNLYTTAGINIVSASSGFVQVLTTGAYPVTTTGPLQVLTSGTLIVSMSSVQVINSASSGVVQLAQVTSSGQSMFLVYTSGGSTATNLTTAASNLKSFMFYNSSVAAFAVKIYNSTAPTIGSTTGQVLVIVAPGSTGGGGANMAFEYPGPYSSNGWSIVPTLSINATSTDAPSSNHPLNITYQV